jgi:cation diffusion facilitator family transporter
MLGRKPKDDNHPYGHGRFETIGTLFVAVLLGFTALELGVYALKSLGQEQSPGWNAIYVAVISISLKEILFWLTMWIGKKEQNRLLQANAWHHRSDALSSVAALIGIGGAQLGYTILDPLAGLVVSALIMKTAWDMGKQSVDELTDAVTDPEVESQVHQLMNNVEGVHDLHEVRVRRMGSYLLVDLHIEVNGHLTVSSAHQIAERARLRITQSLPTVTEVLVHVDPEPDPPSRMPEEETQLMRPQDEIEQDIASVLEQVPQVQKITHIYCHYLHRKLLVHIHVEMEENLIISEARLIAIKAEKLVELIADVQEADVHLELSPH